MAEVVYLHKLASQLTPKTNNQSRRRLLIENCYVEGMKSSENKSITTSSALFASH